MMTPIQHTSVLPSVTHILYMQIVIDITKLEKEENICRRLQHANIG